MIGILKDYGKQNVTIKSVARVLGTHTHTVVEKYTYNVMYMYIALGTYDPRYWCVGMMANSLTGLPESVPFMVR